jgi:predicted N-acetyltransferase YhbS
VAEITRRPNTLYAPERLTDQHDFADFDCGKEELNTWLRERALLNEGRASRTFVICRERAVVGFYSLAAGAVIREDLPRKIRHGNPQPVPVLVIGRLAVHNELAGQGLGAALLQDAILRAITASQSIGAGAILVHAKDADAAGFYKKYGFIPSPTNDLTFILPIETAIAALE